MSTQVLFFGGYHASPADVNAWRDSAKAQQPDVQFEVFPWPPGAGADDKSAVAGFTKAGLKKVIAGIGSAGADLTYIVGHSSGCAIANAVDSGLKDHSKVVLIALDGFVPDGKQLARETTQCWGAVCGDAKSRNYGAMKASRRLHVYRATDCKTMWALHFSLVNAAANDKVVKSIRTGYAQCRANLVWLK